MAFSFTQNTGQNAFGTANKTSGFSFGSNTGTAAAPAFGTGSTGAFGTGTTGGFGSTSTGATGGFGSTSTGTTGGFGSTSTGTTGGFGSTTTGNTGGFAGFGNTTSTSGGGLAFGAQSTAGSTGGFGFGATTTTTQSFSFGQKPAATTTASGFSFGSNTTSGFGTGTGTSAFGSTNTGTFGTGAFGSTNTGTSAFGSTGTGGFGTGTGGLFGGGLKTSQPLNFGTSTNTFKGFGQPQQQPQQQLQQQMGTALCPNVSLYMAVCAPAFFGDERDEVLKKWNQLQAVWGSGKGYFAPNLPPVELTPDNEFCRFKAVGYIKMPSFSPEEGLVEIVINKKDSIVREQQTNLVAELCKIYGGNVQICVEYVKPGPGDNKTRLCFYVQTRNPNGETKKANTWDVYNHLKGDQFKQSITNLCIEHATPLIALSESQLKDYLDKPPRGIDPLIWEQGKRANPEPSKYLPVPLVGFQELQARFKAQETESTLLQGQLDKIAEDVCSVQQRQATLLDQLKECNRKQEQMAHRVLQLVVKQECKRKRGVPIDGNEEQLRIRLENMYSQLMAPTQYMGKLNELLSQMSAKGKNGGYNNPEIERMKMSEKTEADIKEFLAWQQDGISEVVAILKQDMKAFDAMYKHIAKK